jgi:cytochrome oxidase Cu insertion factor (SCO1/SenC/PrrC family)
MFKHFKYLFIALSFFVCQQAEGQIVTTGFEEENNIYKKVYDARLNVNKDVVQTMAQLYGKKPILLALIYTRCSGICNPFLVQLKENLQFKTDADNFKVLVLSFDPRDTRQDMQQLAHWLNLENNQQWIFATTADIKKLDQSVGFKPSWDSIRSQYDHDALLVGINKEGYITKKLIGLRSKADVASMISSVNDVFSPSYRLPGKNQLFSCFNYNPQTGKNTPGLGLLVLALPAILSLMLVLGISYSVRRKEI